MATAALLAFIEAVERDDRLRAQIETLVVSDDNDVMADVVRIAAEAGHTLSAGEVAKGLAELAKAELADADLEGVAGGLVGPCDRGVIAPCDRPESAFIVRQPRVFSELFLKIQRTG